MTNKWQDHTHTRTQLWLFMLILCKFIWVFSLPLYWGGALRKRMTKSYAMYSTNYIIMLSTTTKRMREIKLFSHIQVIHFSFLSKSSIHFDPIFSCCWVTYIVPVVISGKKKNIEEELHATEWRLLVVSASESLPRGAWSRKQHARPQHFLGCQKTGR